MPDYVLIVEDDPDDAGLVRDVLDVLKIESRTVFNGQKALELIAESPPRAIVLDLMLPVMDGYAMLTALREMAGGDTIPIILVTALDDGHDPALRRLPGVIAVLSKGEFSFDRLRAALDRALAA